MLMSCHTIMLKYAQEHNFTLSKKREDLNMLFNSKTCILQYIILATYKADTTVTRYPDAPNLNFAKVAYDEAACVPQQHLLIAFKPNPQIDYYKTTKCGTADARDLVKITEAHFNHIHIDNLMHNWQVARLLNQFRFQKVYYNILSKLDIDAITAYNYQDGKRVRKMAKQDLIASIRSEKRHGNRA